MDRTLVAPWTTLELEICDVESATCDRVSIRHEDAEYEPIRVQQLEGAPGTRYAVSVGGKLSANGTVLVPEEGGVIIDYLASPGSIEVSTPRLDVPVPRGVWLEMSVGPCFGTCSSWQAVLCEDGRLYYSGGPYARRAGLHERQLGSRERRRVESRLEELTKHPSFPVPLFTDHGYVLARYRAYSAVWEHVHAFGAKLAPPTVFRTYRELERALGIRSWVVPRRKRQAEDAGGERLDATKLCQPGTFSETDSDPSAQAAGFLRGSASAPRRKVNRTPMIRSADAWDVTGARRPGPV